MITKSKVIANVLVKIKCSADAEMLGKLTKQLLVSGAIDW